MKVEGLDVTVLGPIVEYDGALPRLLVDGILRDTPLAGERVCARAGIRERDLAMKPDGNGHRAQPISRSTMSMCRDGRCDEFVEGNIPMQFDAGHLTAKGSIEVGRRLIGLFAGKPARAADVSH